MTSELAKKIQERIYNIANDRQGEWGEAHASIVRAVSFWFSDGKFDDILGPEVTADVVADLRWFFDGTDLWDLAHDEIRMGGNVDSAMRYRRLAKWLRQLERSAQRG